MCLPIISGYELGQFLRILLWIFLPVAILSMLVTTWLHYRRRRRESGEILLSIEGLDTGNGREEIFVPVRLSENGGEGEKDTEGEDQEYRDTVYKGILWMKEKYEQYRDMADQRYERLKDEHTKAEQKYQDLLASIEEGKTVDRGEKVSPGAATAAEVERDSLRDLLIERNQQIIFLQGQLDQRIKDFHFAEHEGRGAKERIRELEDQLQVYRQKVEELVDKLRNNSLLLMNIYQDLDKSLKTDSGE